MFKKILIANRGEIACRIIETASKLHIKTVAVYSDADKQARHVTLADEAVYIGASEAKQSYLDGDKIIKAALRTGAECIHPGYGFLSENPEFVQAVEAAGLVFVGPSADAISAMGLKDAAKSLMEKAGVPVVPGYHGASQDPALIKDKARQIGYPVLIKARAGGGGKGMRLVESEAEFDTALQSAVREAENAFSDGAVLVEKYIQAPRHIEVQVFGDQHGSVVHLFERDCSVQRRHQKVIEEAPAPGMTAEVREAMTEAAVTAAKAINYHGAGTIEFIADGSDGLQPDKFWFMEMNTRLQVEHPVTEEITGVDLVEWQLRVAAGETLPRTQEQIEIRGHAFEARIYAEDVTNDFLPVTGDIHHVSFGPARVDTGVVSGDEISPFYDPMIAKVTTHSATRSMALAQLHTALSETLVAGLTTNVTFLRSITTNPSFAEGQVDTGFIADNLDSLITSSKPSIEHTAFAILASSEIDFTDPLIGWRHWGSAQYGFEIQSPQSDPQAVVILFEGKSVHIILGDHAIKAHAIHIGDGAISAELDGIKTSANLHRMKDGNGIMATVHYNGSAHSFFKRNPLRVEASDAASGTRILAPMTGIVRAVNTKIGQAVSVGDPVMVLEAMKMEHVLLAPCTGTLTSLACSEGDQVSDGQILVEFETTEDA